MANQKADKAMETSDLSTTEAHSDVEECSIRARHRYSPARYSPPPLQDNRPRTSTTAPILAQSPPPPPHPQTPVSIPGGLLARSSSLVGHNSNAMQQSPFSLPAGPSTSHASASASGHAASADQPGHAAVAGKLILPSEKYLALFVVLTFSCTKVI